jgi:hypothetical protein
MLRANAKEAKGRSSNTGPAWALIGNTPHGFAASLGRADRASFFDQFGPFLFEHSTTGPLSSVPHRAGDMEYRSARLRPCYRTMAIR